MALITRKLVLEKADSAISQEQLLSKADISDSKLEQSILIKTAKKFSTSKTYDIFLSHSYLDKKEIIGLKKIFEDIGHSVYIVG